MSTRSYSEDENEMTETPRENYTQNDSNNQDYTQKNSHNQNHRQHDRDNQNHRQHVSGNQNYRQHDSGNKNHRQHDSGNQNYRQHDSGNQNHRQHDNHSQNYNRTAKSDPIDSGPQPRYLSKLARGRTGNFFINGDIFFPSKKVVYNPTQFKDFACYMDYLTERLGPRFGVVRRICTPNHGHRIGGLDDLQDNGAYVVVGNGKFKPYRYDQISNEKRRSQPFNYDVDPVYHNRQFMSSGKIKKCETQSLLIKVWPNGGDLKGPRRVLITPRIKPYTLPNVVAHINEILKEDCVGTVEKLYFLSGSQVSDADQIIHNGQYVACRKTERFKKARYNDQAVKNLATSPRLDRKLLAPLFPRPMNSNSTSQSSNEHSQSSTQSSVISNPHRRRAHDDNDDRVFPAKPVKYTRDSEKVRKVDLDKDPGGLFRAKQNNINKRGAKEVADSRHMKTDLPVDQWDAQEIDEDNRVKNLDMKKSDANRRNKRLSSDDRLEEENEAAARIQAGYRGYETRKDHNSFPSKSEQGRNKNDQRRNKTDQVDNKTDRNHNAEKSRYDYPNSQSQKTSTNNVAKQTVGEKKPAVNRDISRKQNGINATLTEEKAAVKIQSSFRGYQTRKRVQEKSAAAAKIQSSYRGHQERNLILSSQKGTTRINTRKQVENMKAVPKQKTTDTGYVNSKRTHPAIREDTYDELDKENSAAMTIQSHYRGYRTRKDLSSQ